MTNQIVITQPLDIQQQRQSLEQSVGVLLYSLSEKSRRVYRHTFRGWIEFAEERGIAATDFNLSNVIEFLEAKSLSKATRQNRLTHIRRLVNMLYAANPSDDRFKSYYEQLKIWRVGVSDTDKSSQKAKKALKRKDVERAMDTWLHDTLLDKRNSALLAVLFYAGLRRSEAVELQWSDIDLEAGLIRVRHGKGDKNRTTPILGDTGVEALRVWRSACPTDRVYVFPNFRKGDTLGNDKHMTAQAVYKVVKASGDFSPHDARRTLITDALAAGSSVADVQYVAGHANASTTLRYAQVKDAKEVKGRVKLTY